MNLRKEVRASPDVVVDEEILCLLSTEVLNRVRPQNITHETVGGRFTESINL